MPAPYQVAQASAPADSAIKAVGGDLDRHEKSAQGLKADATRAKQILKLLGISEKRLNGSKNKEHPSRVATNQRLAGATAKNIRDLEAMDAAAAQPLFSPSSTRWRNSSVELTLGKGASGTGCPRKSHSGGQPSATRKLNRRSAGTARATSALCAS